ncbi:YopX family protein [Chitinophaga sp. RCC_12]|uniref:YopX family protein n=1 Tax=Chitinophaga sp. RCC_12 TaxID=3239226 RepID=UPI003525C5DA
MREIKFRAFCKPFGIMCRVSEIDFLNNMICLVISKWRSIQDAYGFADVEIMQFTGLNDSNGIDIYEGDIIRASGYYYKKTHDMSQARRFVASSIPDSYETVLGVFPFIVVWNTDFSGWGFKSSIHQIATNVSERNYEVIGNIYQHPELIKTLNAEQL